MKVTRFGSLFALVALTAASFGVERASGATIFYDDFESGTMANWTQTSATAGTNLVNANDQNIVPAGGSRAAKLDNSADRMHRNIIGDNGGTELSGASKFISWIYDDGNASTLANRVYNEVRGYTLTGLPNGGITADGTLSQLIAIGKHNAATNFGTAWTGTKYQARVLTGTAGQTGWTNLDGAGSPNRTLGWHKFTIERLADNTTYNFFVDDILSKTVTGVGNFSWDTIVIGAGLGTQAGVAWIDGVEVTDGTIVPEPATFVMAGIAVVGCLATRRRSA